MARFTLTIELGNDAMRTWRDIGNELEALAETLHERDEVIGGGDAEPVSVEDDIGAIRDVNGNRVGRWTVTP
jgi:hypothetical protein